MKIKKVSGLIVCLAYLFLWIASYTEPWGHYEPALTLVLPVGIILIYGVIHAILDLTL